MKQAISQIKVFENIFRQIIAGKFSKMIKL